jgi:hypothetical protein
VGWGLVMLLGRDDIARGIAYRHRPWWTVWYGHTTCRYWALPRWVEAARAVLIDAPTPEALEAAISTFEMFNPKPSRPNERCQ